MKIVELQSIFTTKVVDFYGVNEVVIKENGDMVLLDCKHPIFEIVNSQPKLLIRHPTDWECWAIKEFLTQNHIAGFDQKMIKIRQMYG